MLWRVPTLPMLRSDEVGAWCASESDFFHDSTTRLSPFDAFTHCPASALRTLCWHFAELEPEVLHLPCVSVILMAAWPA